MSNVIKPSVEPSTAPAGLGKPSSFRWVICGLLFYATTINYVDRSVFGVLAGDLQKVIGWHDWQFGLINAAFTLAYAIGFIIMGRLIDTIGTRFGYAIALTIWTIAGACTSLAGSPFGFGVARFGLGIGEAGNFPAAIKTVAEWFPQKQRATATGIFNAGSNVGAILAPFLVPFVVYGFGSYMLNKHPEKLIPETPAAVATVAASAPAVSVTSGPGASLAVNPAAPALASVPLTLAERTKQTQFNLGWPAAFFITPTLALIWIAFWLALYRTPDQSRFANRAEVVLIQGDQVASPTGLPVKWRNLLPHRQAWAFMMGKMLTDPIWWFYLFWSGKFFKESFNQDLKGLAGPLILVYVLADFGSIAGGYLSSALLKRGWTANAARKTAMGTCAVLILPVIMAPMIPNTWISPSGFNWGMWTAATLIGVAAAAHQGFSANIFTTTSDMFPKRAISSVVGMGGLAGALGGMVMQAVAGVIKEVTNSYLIMFIIAGSVYVLAVLIIHLLAPRLARVPEEDLENKSMPLAVTGVLGAVLGFVIGVPISYFFQSQHTGLGESMLPYLSSIITGDIFKPAGAVYVHPLMITPLLAAVAVAIVGVALHAMLFRSSKNRPQHS
ncbi:MAG TPA: MFS transporter [Phycisphaerae bacterium]|jgi:ACS family hexuronate transporter-like MFS transporter